MGKKKSGDVVMDDCVYVGDFDLYDKSEMMIFVL